MKEPNATKLFVGQIPHEWTEEDLRPIFEPFGDIHTLRIIKDQISGKSKGCAFLIYYENDSANACQEELHEKKTLPGLKHTLQVKPATSEKKEENRKLFLGMLSRDTNETDLQTMFSPYGKIEDIAVLKNFGGKSKGCAFIKFETRTQAQNAIKHMHNSVTLEGCSSPIIVKVADTEKEKANKKNFQMQNAAGQSSLSSRNAPVTGLVNNAINHLPQQQPQYQQLFTQVALPSNQYSHLVSNPNVIGASSAVPGAMGALVGTAIPNQHQLPPQQGLQPLISYPAGVLKQPTMQSNLTANSATAALQNPLNGASLISGGVNTYAGSAGLGALGGIVTPGSTFGAGVTGVAPAGLAAVSALPADSLQQAYSGIQQYVANIPQTYTTNLRQSSGFQHLQQQQQQQQQQIHQQPIRREGPDDANLFIYHLPVEYNDRDLLQAFAPFGNVTNAKVYVDKNTQLSKCFGFVSYDNPASASLAIRSMNGLAVGSKRLKVQLKRPKERSKPY